MKEIIFNQAAPDPIGPYSQAVRFGHMVFTSGQVALDAATGTMLQNNLQEEAHQVMKNLQLVLQASGAEFKHVVKTTIFLTDMAFFSEVNEVYGSYFPEGTFPARETVQVSALPRQARVEISMIACLPQ